MTRKYLPEAVWPRAIGAFAAGSILAGFLQDLDYLVFTHLMVMYMRQPSSWIDIKSRLQAFDPILTPNASESAKVVRLLGLTQSRPTPLPALRARGRLAAACEPSRADKPAEVSSASSIQSINRRLRRADRRTQQLENARRCTPPHLREPASSMSSWNRHLPGSLDKISSGGSSLGDKRYSPSQARIRAATTASPHPRQPLKPREPGRRLPTVGP